MPVSVIGLEYMLEALEESEKANGKRLAWMVMGVKDCNLHGLDDSIIAALILAVEQVD